MHDPMTVAFRLNIPFTGTKDEKGGWKKYPYQLATIWHVDPEADGTDDSCGWFMRARHGDKKVLESIEKRYKYEWDEFFDNNGKPLFSPGAITLFLFRLAAYEHFGDWKKSDRFIQKNLAELLFFAENPVDSLNDAIMKSYPSEKKEERIHHFAVVIYPYVLRNLRPWWKHPKWHIWHWKIQVDPVQYFKRWAFSRCSGCGKRFEWGYSVTSTQWGGTGPLWFRSERNVYHRECVPVSQRQEKEAPV